MTNTRSSFRALRLAILLAAPPLLTGCTVLAVADTAGSIVVGTVGLAADAVIGTARMVLPDGDDKDKK